MDISIQSQYIKDATDTIHREHPELDATVVSRVRRFLLVDCGANNLKPFQLSVVNNREIAVVWDDGRSIVTAQFKPNTNDWEWTAVTVEGASTSTEEGDGSYSVGYHHKGACSYLSKSDGHASYWFPEKVDELISMPDAFTQTYEPILNKYEYEIVWETSKHDGMLAGYCRVRGEPGLHYVSMVEETDYRCKRMYAIYELSWLERAHVWFRYHKWHLQLQYQPLWDLHIWWWRKFGRLTLDSVAQHRANQERWKNSHKIVGYFEG